MRATVRLAVYAAFVLVFLALASCHEARQARRQGLAKEANMTRAVEGRRR